MITLEKTLTSRGYYDIEREREREKEKIFFALLMAQNASNEKLGFWPVGKKSKVSCLARNGSMGVKQVVFFVILFD